MNLNRESSFLLVDKTVLPEVFLKVMEAKEHISSGRTESSSEAARLAGISRSAFYKYKDSVYPYYEHTSSRIVTIHTVLKDKPGVLSGFISAISAAGANILTLNQNIPVNGKAAVSVSARINGLSVPLDMLISDLSKLDGIERIENITGEGNHS